MAVRRIDTVPLKNSHHVADPRKTPRTVMVAPMTLFDDTMPIPVNTAANDAMVVGFVRVSANVER